jgi:methanogenic corrinoid protein MtbC1
MAGWDTYYLGANTPLASIVDAVVARHADALAISATMTYHVPAVAEVLRAVKERLGERAPFVLVGGYPFLVDPSLWQRVGADGCATDAPGAVALVTERVRNRPRV